MAKFCSKCNSPMNDGDIKCGYCGAVANEAPAQAPAKKKQKVDLAKLMKDPKAKKFAPVAIVAAALVVVLLVVAIASGVGYKGVAKKYMKAMVKGDADKYVNVISGKFFDEDFDEEDMADYKENFVDSNKDGYDELEEEYGSNVKVKYNIISTYDVRNEDALENIEERLQDEEIKYGKEVKAKVVVFLVTVKGEDDQTTYVDQVTLVKEDGKWKVYEKSILDSYYL